MLSKKQQLTSAALDYLAENGLADFSLRPLAAELGTSARMLMFHFKSKEGLLRDVVAELNARLQASFATLLAADAENRNGDAPLLLFWKWAVGKRNFRYLRLLYELQVLAVQNPAEFGDCLKESSAGWRTVALHATSSGLRSEAMATLSIAVFDGLFLELMGTGDKKRLSEALDLFVSLARRQSNDNSTTSCEALKPPRADTSAG